MSVRRVIFTLFVWVGAAAMHACGGGGSDGSSQPRDPVVSVGQTSVRVERESTWTYPVTETIGITVSNVPESGLYVASTEPPDMLQDVSITARTQTTGDLSFQFVPPSEIGPGIHTGAMAFAFCIDSACEMPIEGSPFEISLTYVVNAPVEPFYPEQEQAPVPPPQMELEPLGVFPHDVVDARYSDALNGLVIVGNQPGPGLYLYSPAMELLASLELGAPGDELELTPDQTRAVVRTDRSFTLVQLANDSGEPDLRVLASRQIGSASVVFDAVIDDDAVIYAVGDIEDGGARLFRLPLRSLGLQSVAVSFHLESVTLDSRVNRLILSPTSTSGVTGRLIFDISDGQMALLRETVSDFFGLCGPLYPIEGRLALAAFCGATAIYSDDPYDALIYDGTLRNPVYREPLVLGAQWVSLSQSGAGEPIVAVQQHLGVGCASQDNTNCASYLTVMDADHLGLIQDFRIPDRQVDGQPQPQRALKVFHTADGSGGLLLSRLLGDVDETTAFALGAFSLGGLTSNPPFEPDPGTYHEPVYSDTYAPLPVTDRRFMSHNVVSGAQSRALELVLLASDFPANALHVYSRDLAQHWTVSLVKQPISLEVSEDGLTAIVGHDARLSVIDLSQIITAQGSGASVVAVPTDAFNFGIGNSGRAFVVAEVDGVSSLRAIDLVTGNQAAAPQAFAEDGPIVVDDMQAAVYLANQHWVYKFDVSSSVPGAASTTNLTSSTEGARLIRLFALGDGQVMDAGGSLYSTSSDPAEDMARVLRLDLGRQDGLEFQVYSVDREAPQGDLVVMTQLGFECRGQIGPRGCSSRVIRYDGATLEQKQAWVVNPVVIDGKPFTQVPMAVFLDESREDLLLVSRLHGNRPPDGRYLFSEVTISETDVAPEYLKTAGTWRLQGFWRAADGAVNSWNWAP